MSVSDPAYLLPIRFPSVHYTEYTFDGEEVVVANPLMAVQ